MLKFSRMLEREGLEGVCSRSSLPSSKAKRDGVQQFCRGSDLRGEVHHPRRTATVLRPRAHQSKRDKNWHFGYKAHGGIGLWGGLVRTVENRCQRLRRPDGYRLLRSGDRVCYADVGYIDKRFGVAGDPVLTKANGASPADAH